MSHEDQMAFIDQLDDQKLAAFAPDLAERRGVVHKMQSVLCHVLFDLEDYTIPGLESNIAKAERDLATKYNKHWLQEELSRLEKEIPMLTSQQRVWRAALDNLSAAQGEKQALKDTLVHLRESLAQDNTRYRHLKFISYELAEANLAIAHGTPNRRKVHHDNAHISPLSPDALRLYPFLHDKDAEDEEDTSDENDGGGNVHRGEEDTEDDDGGNKRRGEEDTEDDDGSNKRRGKEDTEEDAE